MSYKGYKGFALIGTAVVALLFAALGVAQQPARPPIQTTKVEGTENV